jgi:hypothetical protein
MLRTLPMVLAIAALLLAGTVYGVWIDRWSLSQEPRASAAKLELVPTEFDDWVMSSDQEIDDQSKAIGGIAGSLSRIYTNRATNQSVACLIVCGRPGAIGAHTPDVCFVGANQRMERRVTKRIPLGTDLPSVEMHTAIFTHSEGGVSSITRAFWSWSADGTWSAPENPRLKFLGKNALYKLYVTFPISREEEEIEDGPGQKFIQALIPVLDRVLFAKDDQARHE